MKSKLRHAHGPAQVSLKLPADFPFLCNLMPGLDLIHGGKYRLVEGLLGAVQREFVSVLGHIIFMEIRPSVLVLEKRGYLFLKDTLTYCCLVAVQTKVLFQKCIFPFVIHSLFHMLFVT